MFGFLSEEEIGRIVTSGGIFADRPRWARRQNALWVRFGGFVDSSIDPALRLNMAVSLERPEKYTIVYLRGDQVLRRLDVRGSHRNPTAVSGQSSIAETHKHRWSAELADQVAYTPSDISTAPSFEAGEHSRVFNEFCTECGISFTGTWVDPPLDVQSEFPMP